MQHPRRLISLLLLLTLLVTPHLATAQSTDPDDPSKVDLRALERQIVVEINRVRTNPAELATTLRGMKQHAGPSRYGLALTLPDASQTTANPAYLNSAITTTLNLQPMNALVWSDGLAKVAGKYASRNPQGHFDFGTNLGSRFAEFGAPTGGSAESIDYGGTTGILATYRLYIDSDTPSLGHRTMMIDPKLTHIGVGCYYKNRYDSITCVLNYAEKWVDTRDMVKLEVGKQYAFREKNNTFRYFKLTSVNQGGAFPLRIDVCPNLNGSISMPNSAGLTTVEAAQADGLTATNEPCDTSNAPRGVLNNGTSLPITSQAPGPVPPTPTTASQGAGQAATPTAAPQGAGQAATLTTASQNGGQVAPTPASQSGGQPGQPEVGKQYAVRNGGNTFRYFKLTAIKPRAGGGTDYSVELCPDPGKLGGGTIANTFELLAPAQAQAQGLTAANQPCAQDVAPFGGSGQAPTASNSTTANPAATPTTASQSGGQPGQPEVGKQYAVRNGGNTFRYFKLTAIKPRAGGGTDYSVELCPDPGKLGGGTIANTFELLAPAQAQAQGLTAANQPCAQDVAPFGGSEQTQPAATPTTANPAATPTAANQNGGQVAPTQVAAPSGNTPPIQLDIGQPYAVRGPNNTFQHVILVLFRASTTSSPIGETMQVTTHYFAACPNRGPRWDIALNDLYKNTSSTVTTVATALAAGLTATNEPCISVESIAGAPQPEHQYAIRGDEDNTFRYARLQLRGSRSGSYTFDFCPNAGGMGTITVSNPKNIVTVSAALGAKLTPRNQPCSTTTAPNGN